MGCDMVVALGQATVDEQRLFGLNLHGPGAEWPVLRRLAGQTHAPGAVIKTHDQELPQARQTFTVLGCGPCGEWGFTHGLNEHNVAMGTATWSSKAAAPRAGLHGSDLVRLTLERSHSTQQALDVLTDLIGRHGQGQGEGVERCDHVFLIVDAREAIVVEASGSLWAASTCEQVRAVSDAAMIRQDWARVAPGLAHHAIANGWWRDDGSKVDFIGCLGTQSPAHAQALKRWGRATLLLEQQNGHIDLWFLRRMLAEHFETTQRRLLPEQAGPLPTLATTFLTALAPETDALPMAWCSFGPPSQAAYFPVFLDGELPAFFNFGADGLAHGLRTREELDRWQARVDQQAEDFAVQGRLLKQQGNGTQLKRQATMFMAQVVEASVSRQEPKSVVPTAQAQDLAYFAE